jgi:hypothetical protein
MRKIELPLSSPAAQSVLDHGESVSSTAATAISNFRRAFFILGMAGSSQ